MLPGSIRQSRAEKCQTGRELIGTGKIENQFWCPKSILRLSDNYQCVSKSIIRSRGESIIAHGVVDLAGAAVYTCTAWDTGKQADFGVYIMD